MITRDIKKDTKFILNPSASMKLDNVIEILNKDRAVVYPTDTAYGLGVDVENLQAVKRLYMIKGRKNQPTHIVVSSLAMAKRYAKFSETAERIFKNFLPGALTLVLPLKDNSLESIKMLSAKSDTIGIRFPDNKVVLRLVRQLGRPVTATSANPIGKETPYSALASYELFKRRKNSPDMYIESGELKKTKPSTIIRIIDNQIEVLRKGPISKKALNDFLKYDK